MDVLYSQREYECTRHNIIGEPFEGYLHPNNTWDLEDSMYEEDYSVKPGWIKKTSYIGWI